MASIDLIRVSRVIAFSFFGICLLMIGCSSPSKAGSYQVIRQFVDTETTPSERFLDGTPFEELEYYKIRGEMMANEPTFTYVGKENTQYMPTITYYVSEEQIEPDFMIDIFDENGHSTSYVPDIEALYRELGIVHPVPNSAAKGIPLKIGDTFEFSGGLREPYLKIIDSETLVSARTEGENIVVSVLVAL